MHDVTDVSCTYHSAPKPLGYQTRFPVTVGRSLHRICLSVCLPRLMIGLIVHGSPLLGPGASTSRLFLVSGFMFDRELSKVRTCVVIPSAKPIYNHASSLSLTSKSLSHSLSLPRGFQSPLRFLCLYIPSPFVHRRSCTVLYIAIVCHDHEQLQSLTFNFDHIV